MPLNISRDDIQRAMKDSGWDINRISRWAMDNDRSLVMSRSYLIGKFSKLWRAEKIAKGYRPVKGVLKCTHYAKACAVFAAYLHFKSQEASGFQEEAGIAFGTIQFWSDRMNDAHALNIVILNFGTAANWDLRAVTYEPQTESIYEIDDQEKYASRAVDW